MVSPMYGVLVYGVLALSEWKYILRADPASGISTAGSKLVNPFHHHKLHFLACKDFPGRAEISGISWSESYLRFIIYWIFRQISPALFEIHKFFIVTPFTKRKSCTMITALALEETEC